MGWSLEVNEIHANGKIKRTIMGNVNSSGKDWIDIALPIEENKEWETFRFSQETGKCHASKNFKLSLKSINYLNDPKIWK